MGIAWHNCTVMPRALAAGGRRQRAEGVRSVERALDVLGAFQAPHLEMSARELCEKVGLTRPTLYRLLAALEKKGFVTSHGNPRRFRLGAAASRLAVLSHSSENDLVALAMPSLSELWTATGETVGLFVHRNGQRICLAELPSHHPLSFKRGVGHSEPITAGASGKAILAHLAPSEPEGRRAATTKLDLELAHIRQRGYAVSRSELIKGAASVAAPFFSVHGAVAGSIAVFGPDVRLTNAVLERCARQVRTRCEAVSAALGFKAIR